MALRIGRSYIYHRVRDSPTLSFRPASSCGSVILMCVGRSMLCCAGNSVCAFVHGFQPYFYIEAPRGFGPDDCDSLCSQLNVRALPYPCQALHDIIHATCVNTAVKA